MRPLLIVLASAVVSAGVAIAILFSAPVSPGSGGGDADGAGPPAEDMQRRVRALEGRVETLEGTVAQQREELAAARRTIEASSEIRPADEPEAAPDLTPAPTAETAAREDDPGKEAMEAVARSMTEKARRDALTGLRRLLDADPEAERAQKQKIVASVRAYAKWLELPDETARQMALALLEADRLSRERFRTELHGRDLTELTRSDMRPLITRMFDERLAAMEPHLDSGQMAQVREKEAGSRSRYESWLHLAFPAR